MKLEGALLSVIVPIYNVEQYLCKCIESIISQTYKNLEIILVDDGSKDASGVIADEYGKKDERIKIIHKENGGLLRARCTGCFAATGDYITFVDSDDWIDENMHQFMMEKMEETGADMVATGHYVYLPNGKTAVEYNRYISEGMYDKGKIHDELMPVMMWDERIDTWAFEPSTWSKIYKKDILMPIMEKLQGMELYYGEDAAITYSYLLYADSLYCTNEAFYYYRQRSESVIPQYFVSDAYFQQLNDVYYYLYSQFIEHDLKDILIKQLDCFFTLSSQHKLRKYNIGRKTLLQPNYLFPFNKVKENDRIVIYGAGRTGKMYVRQLNELDYGILAAWVDRQYRQIGDFVSPPEVIRNLEFDYVVIAITSGEAAEEAKKVLNGMGIPERKIIHQITQWFR